MKLGDGDSADAGVKVAVKVTVTGIAPIIADGCVVGAADLVGLGRQDIS